MVPVLESAVPLNSPHFGVSDYVIFGIMLLVSVGIGIYFGYFDNSEQTTDEYLMGGGNMKTIPIAISLVASQLSAMTLMSLPPEAYAFGSHFMVMTVPMLVVVTLFLNYTILPIFYKNKIDNCYAYLELRFSKSVRNLITGLFVVLMLLTLPITCFVPSMAFSEVTGLNIHLINVIVTLICVAYTMMGGIKAVVWTDVIQAIVMVAFMAIILICSIIRVGGIGEVISRSVDGDRLSAPLWNIDFSTRQTVWNLSAGMFTLWVAHNGLNQSCVQRMVALPSLQHARRAMIIFCVGVIVIVVTSCLVGTIMYAHYKDCDPIQAMIVGKTDQMVPYFVNDILGHIDGMTGLFISSVFSASLSTVSASINTLAGILYKDYVCPIKGFRPTEMKANVIMKSFVVLMGVYCVGFGVVVENSSSLFQLIFTMAGLTQGAVVGVFTIGFFFPKANHKAVFYAAWVSMITMGFIITMGLIYRETNNIFYLMLPTSVKGCAARDIFSLTSAPDENTEDYSYSTSAPDENTETTTNSNTDSFWHEICTMSFQWYAPIGVFIVWVIGVPLSYLVGPQDGHLILNKDLISPLAHRMMSQEPSHVPMQIIERKKDSRLNETNTTYK